MGLWKSKAQKGKKAQNQQSADIYLMMDSRGTPIARGRLDSSADAGSLLIQVLDDRRSAVMEHEQIQMAPLRGNGPTLLGRITSYQGDSIVLEKLQTLDSEMRQNLRMPTHFQSFLYPVTGAWRGRLEVEANDLSCGGIAFFCGRELGVGEQTEVVIPVTREPVVLRCEVLRRRPSDRAEALYAAKFVDLCDDEEMLVREAVYILQRRSRSKPAGFDVNKAGAT